jgi:hypothetical protein
METRLRVVVRQQFRLGLLDLGKAPLQDLGDLLMIELARALQ